MAEIWKPQPTEVYLSWIEALKEEVSDELTTWEINFIGNIEYWLKARGSISEAQANTLERIYSEKTK